VQPRVNWRWRISHLSSKWEWYIMQQRISLHILHSFQALHSKPRVYDCKGLRDSTAFSPNLCLAFYHRRRNRGGGWGGYSPPNILGRGA